MNVGVQRGAIAAVQVLGLAVWFSMSAVVPSLRHEWGLTAGGAVWLTASVQCGFVAGAVASTALNLADRFPPQRLLAASAASAAACTVVLALAADGPGVAVPLRFLTGMFLAGVYPVGMKLMASWAGSAGRGRTMGVLIAALTLGSTLPHLIAGLGSLPWRGVLLTAAGAGLAGSVVSLVLIRTGPYAAPAAPARNARYALAMFTQRGPRLANLGYFGHMWELYALWTWIPSFLSATGATDGLPGSVEITVFLAMGLGGAAGCLLGGWGADRFGRSPAALAALLLSGLCCLASPFLFDAPPLLLFAFCTLWGAAVIADSGVFSTSLSEVADHRYVGTALTGQTAIGFALTVLSIQLTPLLAEAVGWRYAFLLLAPGPLVGALAMRAFGRAVRVAPARAG
ncbi:MFS transporter [Streptomyces capillispiralis]|uniref:Sugar phosphate permease n=1 Tax=Streptomyces capillispiralis TaxID=68182 RepID=A0A561TRX0_9ACTN|nr:MFS transporter [Streptomyces capillispiralis]TWF89855.1 sugar phosphate permease [Streptomyces capillispiralis]